MQKLLTLLALLSLSFIAFVGSSEELPPPGIFGPSPVTLGNSYTYEFADPGFVGDPMWTVAGGSINYSYYSSGSYFCVVQWTATGKQNISFYDAFTQLATKAVTVNGGSSPPPAPNATVATSVTTSSFTANWNSSTGATSYRLDVSKDNFATFVSGYSNLTVSTTSQAVLGLTSGTSYKYRARAVNAGGTSSNSTAITVQTPFENNENYVVTNTIMIPHQVESTVSNLEIDQGKRSQSYQYVDGLGRPLQSVVTMGSPNKKDIVQPIAYDDFGREAIKYLPYASTDNNGWFKDNFVDKDHASYTISDQAKFYQGLTAPNIATDSRPYTEIEFEASPLNRPEKQYGAGDDWYTNGKYVGMEYLINKHGTNSANGEEKIIAWDLNASGFPIRHLVVTNYILTGGYYNNGQLFVNVAKDEQGNAVREYTNKQGQVILKKVQADATANSYLNDYTKWASTYYVYDDFGNLRYVFPPELTKLFNGSDTRIPTSTANGELDTWAFQYKYDGRKRMIEKRVPGSGWVVMVYDKRDRLVMTQDAVQKPLKQWLYTKYDVLNRPIITGLYTHGSDIARATMEGLISTTNFFETYNGATATHGYSNTIFPTTGTVLTVTYYDNYSFKTLIGGTTYNYLASEISGLPTSENLKVIGQATGSKTNVLGSATYLWSVNYYDDKYRPIQTVSTNNVSGTDRTSSKYDFVKLLETKTTHKKGATTYTTKRRFDYDHTGRILKTWHSYNGASEVLLAQNEYNELGELITKQLHSRDNGSTFKQKIDYRYNIRGWLNTVNDPLAPEASDLFSMDMRYNDPTSKGGAAQYNGNISEIIWNTAGAGKQSFGYTYDNLNRLTDAKYYDAAHVLKNDRFNETIKNANGTPGYDLNGNIIRLVRNGDRPSVTPNPQGTVDELNYYYVGNQLKVVNDTKPDNANEIGFKELVEKSFNGGNTDAQNEYAYDKNGNMTKDDNKGITAITYNYLNLPVQVNKGASNYIVYTYDATGRKLKQQVFGTTPKTTEYSGEYIYEGGVLKFVSHEEGRILPVGNGEYQYFLKDHLGNTRLSFSEGTTSTPYLATMEKVPTSVETSENAMFKNMVTSKKIAFYPHSQTYSYRLSGSSGEVVGPAKSMVVSTGDVVDMEVYARYSPATTTNSSVGTFLTAIVGAFALNPGGGAGIDGSQAYNAFNSTFSGGAWIGSGDYEDQTAPKAFINYLLFDNNFVLVDAGFDQVTSIGATAHDNLALHVKVDQPGYLYIYLSNENAKIQDVYFDDFKIMHHTNIEQSDDYYAFGLTFNSYSRENSTPNDYKYNGKEEQTELGLGWLDYGMRMYQPELGRFFTQDRFAEKYSSLNPYQYAANNPVLFIDVNGDSINVAEQYRNQFTQVLQSIYGSNASSFTYSASGNLIFSGNTEDFNEAELSAFNDLNGVMGESTITNVVFEKSHTITDNDGNKLTIDPRKSGGEATALVGENNISQNYVVIDPAKNVTGNVYEVTDAYYNTPIDPNGPPRFNVASMTTSVENRTLHGLGHVIHRGQSQDKVIGFDNKTRGITKGVNSLGYYPSPLPARKHDETHNRTVKTGVYGN